MVEDPFESIDRCKDELSNDSARHTPLTVSVQLVRAYTSGPIYSNVFICVGCTFVVCMSWFWEGSTVGRRLYALGIPLGSTSLRPFEDLLPIVFGRTSACTLCLRWVCLIEDNSCSATGFWVHIALTLRPFGDTSICFGCTQVVCFSLLEALFGAYLCWF